jgi:protein-S-isoprenylcysteine O-methyltransferase Ste14
MSTWIDRPVHSPPSPGFASLGRVAATGWFVLLALAWALRLRQLVSTIHAASPSFTAWAPVLSNGCTVVFLATSAWLILSRPPAAARRPGLRPRLFALAGTYGIWAVVFLPWARLPPALEILSAAVTLLGSFLVVFTLLHLGKSFSIGPQARRLVTRGPYALVRHPLYAAEEIALLGVAMHIVWYAALPFLAVHIALQLKRMSYEEQILCEVFPDYGTYARRTARWIPGLW